MTAESKTKWRSYVAISDDVAAFVETLDGPTMDRIDSETDDGTHIGRFDRYRAIAAFAVGSYLEAQASAAPPAEVSEEDINMAAAYLAPIVWSGAEWHQCTSSMKDAVRAHVRNLRGVGHGSDRATRPAVLSDDEVEALSTVIAHIRRHKDWLDVEDGMFEWEGLVIDGLFRRIGKGSPATSVDEERLAILAKERATWLVRDSHEEQTDG